MINKDLAVVVQNSNACVNILETIDAIEKAGFKNVFIQWYNKDLEISQEEQLKYIRKKGLNVIFAHLGYKNINEIWNDNSIGEELVENYKNDIKICEENNIPMVILHLTSGINAPIYNELGLKRIKQIVEYAKSLNIKIAFENTKIKGYLEYVLDNIKDENVGVCFDSGHYHAHFKDDFNFSLFKNRIFAVHLHDNKGNEDEHLLPFDGTLDWDKLIYNLKEANYNGPIILEPCYRNSYLNITVEEFYKRGYEVGNELNRLFHDKKKKLHF